MSRTEILIEPIRAWATRHVPYLRDRARRATIEAQRAAREAHAQEIFSWLSLFARASENLAEQWSARRALPTPGETVAEGRTSEKGLDLSGRAGLFQGIGRVRESPTANTDIAPQVELNQLRDSRWFRTNLRTNYEGLATFTLRCCITSAQIHINTHPLVPAIGDTRWDCSLDLTDFVEAIHIQAERARMPSELQWFMIVVFDSSSKTTALEYITTCAEVVLEGESTLPPWDYVAFRRDERLMNQTSRDVSKE